jgi:hypothetical protein
MTQQITRRAVLVGTASAVSIATISSLHSVTLNPNFFSAIITDARCDESQAFLGGMIGKTVRNIDVREDPCGQWYRFLREAVIAEEGALAGLTTWIDFEIIRRCAFEVGLHCKTRGDHAPVGPNRVVHTLTGGLTRLGPLLTSPHADPWPAILATGLSRNDCGSSPFAAIPRTFESSNPSRRSGLLVSWILRSDPSRLRRNRET